MLCVPGPKFTNTTEQIRQLIAFPCGLGEKRLAASPSALGPTAERRGPSVVSAEVHL